MKVALIGPLPSKPGEPVGGVQAAVEMLCQGLSDLGVEVVAIDPFTGTSGMSNWPFEVHRLAATPSWRMAMRKAPRGVRDVVDAAAPDVLHVHLGMQFTSLHSKSVATVHGFPHLESQLRNSRLRSKVTAPVLRRVFYNGVSSAKCVVSISDEVSRVTTDLNVPSVRIPNPIDSRFFDVERSPGDDFVAIGDIMRRKNQRSLIEGFVEYVQSGGTGDLLIIGGIGDRVYSAECRAAARPLRGRIQFLGPQSREQLLWHLGHARASVSASLRETSSIAISEALASNCPVLALDVGTARQQIDSLQDGGVVLPLHATTQDLSRAFQTLAAAPTGGRHLRSQVMDQHPISVATETLALYRSLTA